MNKLRNLFIVVTALCLLTQALTAQTADAKPKQTSAKAKSSPPRVEEGVTGNLVTTQWLNQHMKDSDVLLLDASSPQLYVANHILGAVSANPYDLMTFGTGPMPVAQ